MPRPTKAKRRSMELVDDRKIRKDDGRIQYEIATGVRERIDVKGLRRCKQICSRTTQGRIIVVNESHMNRIVATATTTIAT